MAKDKEPTEVELAAGEVQKALNALNDALENLARYNVHAEFDFRTINLVGRLPRVHGDVRMEQRTRINAIWRSET